jgi:hypothetical protein
MKLTQEDAARFYDLFFKLIDYTNDRYQVVSGLKKASGAENVDPTAIMPVRDKLWESDDIINRIVADNPFYFTERELSLVAGWRKRCHSPVPPARLLLRCCTNSFDGV